MVVTVVCVDDVLGCMITGGGHIRLRVGRLEVCEDFCVGPTVRTVHHPFAGVALCTALMRSGFLAIANRNHIEVYPRRPLDSHRTRVFECWLRSGGVDRDPRFRSSFERFALLRRLRQRFQCQRCVMGRVLEWWARCAGRRRTLARTSLLRSELMARACEPGRLVQIVDTEDAAFLRGEAATVSPPSWYVGFHADT